MDIRLTAMSDGLPIETVRLSKTYGASVEALTDLDLRVERGEVFGYLGPNGAGKSTTIRLLLGLIRPTAGSATVFGIDAWRRPVEAHARVGYLPGDLRLSDRLTGGEQLESFARLRGGLDARLRVELCERLASSSTGRSGSSRRATGRSSGSSRRSCIVPTWSSSTSRRAGSTRCSRARFAALIRETAGDGRTVFLSSHSLDEVQHVAERVGDHPLGTASPTSTPSTACASARSGT